MANLMDWPGNNVSGAQLHAATTRNLGDMACPCKRQGGRRGEQAKGHKVRATQLHGKRMKWLKGMLSLNGLGRMPLCATPTEHCSAKKRFKGSSQPQACR